MKTLRHFLILLCCLTLVSCSVLSSLGSGSSSDSVFTFAVPNTNQKELFSSVLAAVEESGWITSAAIQSSDITNATIRIIYISDVYYRNDRYRITGPATIQIQNDGFEIRFHEPSYRTSSATSTSPQERVTGDQLHTIISQNWLSYANRLFFRVYTP